MTYYNIQVAKCIDAKLIDRNAFDDDTDKNLIVTLDRPFKYDNIYYINFNIPNRYINGNWNYIYGSAEIDNSIVVENEDTIITPDQIINKYVILSSEPIFDDEVRVEEDLYIELSSLENPSIDEINIYLEALKYCKE